MIVIEPVPEGAELFLKLKNNAGVINLSIYLEAVPDYSCII